MAEELLHCLCKRAACAEATCCSRGPPKFMRRLQVWSPVPARCSTQALLCLLSFGCSSLAVAILLSGGRASYTLPWQGVLLAMASQVIPLKACAKQPCRQSDARS